VLVEHNFRRPREFASPSEFSGVVLDAGGDVGHMQARRPLLPRRARWWTGAGWRTGRLAVPCLDPLTSAAIPRSAPVGTVRGRPVRGAQHLSRSCVLSWGQSFIRNSQMQPAGRVAGCILAGVRECPSQKI